MRRPRTCTRTEVANVLPWTFPARIGAIAATGMILLALGTLTGCGRKSTLPEGRPPPNPSAPARYGPPKTVAFASGATNRPAGPATNGATSDWRSAPFYVLESELSPGVLIHSTGRYLGLFTGLARLGLGAPSHVAWSTPSGPRAFKNGESLDQPRLEENWVLVWFSGAKGWTNWDCPWAVFLQHHPASMRLDPDGLHFSFSNRVDDVVLMPLYGTYKPPLNEMGFPATTGLPAKKVKVKTWEWPAALPRDPLVRVRYWAGATRRFPIGCQESFSVHRAEDALTFRWQFAWQGIEDYWKTKPLRVAPLSPTLGLALAEPGLPIRFNARPFDLELATPYGPWFGAPDTDTIEATFSLLQYIHETQVVPVRGGTNTQSLVVAARETLARATRDGAPLTENVSWTDLAWAARALPHLDPQLQTNWQSRLRGRLRLPGSSTSEGGQTAASGLAPGYSEALASYAHFANDWEFVRQQWPLLRALWIHDEQATWPGFGRNRVTAQGDLGTPAIAMARLAYQVGDMELYHSACAQFVRDLIQVWARHRGADYFRQNQPVHSSEFIPATVFLTDVDAALPGWRMDGPRFPAVTDERRYLQRWARFGDWDMGRFYQDHLGRDVQRELAALPTFIPGGVAHWPSNWPSWTLLNALLRDGNGTNGHLPAHRSEANALDSGGPALGLAEALGLLRRNEPVRFERLIPGGTPSPFQASIFGPDAPLPAARRSGSGLTVQVAVHSVDGTNDTTPVRTTPTVPAASWPGLTWPQWLTPSGEPWSFGTIKASRSGSPRRIQVLPVNPHTRVIVGELP
jgi:hypothetical protein